MGGKSLLAFLMLTPALLPCGAKAWELSLSTGLQRELFRGWVKYKGTKVDLKDDLRLNDKSGVILRAVLKHKIPLLPELKIDYLRAKTSGVGKLNRNITFGGVTFTANDRIKADFKADQFDLTFFYAPVNSQNLTLEWGLGVKYLTGYTKIKSINRGAYSNTNYDVPVPYFFLRSDFRLSLLHTGFEGKGITYSGNYFYDWKLFAGLMKNRFFLDIGYRYERLKISDIEDFSGDLKVKGVFGQIGVKF